MATLKELTPLIQVEWQQWTEEKGREDLLLFFAHLQNSRPELLKFRCAGAPIRKIKEIVHGKG
jgi:alpha-L-fucosidase